MKNGVDLKWAVQPRPLLAYIWAVLTVAALAPLHRYALALGFTGFRVHLLQGVSIFYGLGKSQLAKAFCLQTRED